MGFDNLARELGPTRNTLLAWAISNWPVLRRSSWPRTLAESASISDASIVVVNDEPHDTTRCCASESRTWHARKLIKLAEVTALNFVSMVVGVLTPYSAVKRALIMTSTSAHPLTDQSVDSRQILSLHR